MANISFKKGLLNDTLFKAVKVHKGKVSFVLKREFNNVRKFTSFLKYLYETHPAAFSRYFFVPYEKNGDCILKLKDTYSRISGEQVIEELKKIASMKREMSKETDNLTNLKAEQHQQAVAILTKNQKRKPWQILLHDKKLIDSLIIKDDIVIVKIKDEYDVLENYRKIMRMLRLLYDKKDALKQRYNNFGYSKSLKGVHLTLKDKQCADPNVLLNELIDAAAPTEKLNISKDLKQGVLIKSVQKHGNRVILIFNDNYDKNTINSHVKKSFYNLHNDVPVFSQVFSKAKIEGSEFIIPLNEGYHELTEAEILSILMTRKLPEKPQVYSSEANEVVNLPPPTPSYLPSYDSLRTDPQNIDFLNEISKIDFDDAVFFNNFVDDIPMDDFPSLSYFDDEFSKSLGLK